MIQMFFLIFFVLLNVISKTTATLDNNKLGCFSDNFRNYTHCIKKREAVNWCSAKGCDTCMGNSCQVSCKGYYCGNCPDGSCCNGRNCNACYNGNCCTTPSCNYCLSTCGQACTNDASCFNACSQQCYNASHDIFLVPSKIQNPGKQDVVAYIKGVPHPGQIISGKISEGNGTAIVTVNGVDYMATVLTLTTNSCRKRSCGTNCANNPSYGKCCNDANCNSCYEECSSKCQVASCHNNCSNKCLNQSKRREESIVYSNPTMNRFNVTTVINITNIINNTNAIDSPIFVNNTNLSNFTIPILAPNESQRIIYQNYYQQLQQGCCHVVHPPQCFNNHIYPYRHCFRRSHQECSNLCTSQFIHLAPNLTPQPYRQNQCHYIKSYPYLYCGQNSVQNCDSCYVCNGRYNPNQCVRQNGCSDICRQTFSPPNSPTIQQPQPNLPYQAHHGSYRLVYPGTPEYQQIMGYLQSQKRMPQGGAPVQYG